MCVSLLQVLGADGLLYQSVPDLMAVGREQNPDIQEFEASCFTGEHRVALVTGHDQTYHDDIKNHRDAKGCFGQARDPSHRVASLGGCQLSRSQQVKYLAHELEFPLLILKLCPVGYRQIEWPIQRSGCCFVHVQWGNRHVFCGQYPARLDTNKCLEHMDDTNACC